MARRLSKIVEKVTLLGLVPIVIAEYELREKVNQGEATETVVTGSLVDFSLTYLGTLGLILSADKVRERYRLILSSALPTLFTLNEFFPFIPHPGYGFRIENVFSWEDIGAYWAAAGLAYFSARGVQSLDSKIASQDDEPTPYPNTP